MRFCVLSALLSYQRVGPATKYGHSQLTFIESLLLAKHCAEHFPEVILKLTRILGCKFYFLDLTNELKKVKLPVILKFLSGKAEIQA